MKDGKDEEEVSPNGRRTGLGIAAAGGEPFEHEGVDVPCVEDGQQFGYSVGGGLMAVGTADFGCGEFKPSGVGSPSRWSASRGAILQ